MTIRIPDTLTIDNSEKYIMSIRLRSGGLSFSVYIPSVPGSFFYKETEFNRNGLYIDSLKEFFFSHDFLTWTYKEIRVLSESIQYTLVPQVLFNEGNKDEFLRFNFVQPATHCLYSVLKKEQAVLVFGIDSEVYEFCSRSFVNPYFYHHIIPQLCFYRQQNHTALNRPMFVVLHSELMDISLYDKDKLAYTNSFAVSKPEDILYIILYVWKQLNLDQQKDYLYLFGEGERRSRLMELLATYLLHVNPIGIPSEAYLLGNDIIHTPMDVIAMTICEL